MSLNSVMPGSDVLTAIGNFSAIEDAQIQAQHLNSVAKAKSNSSGEQARSSSVQGNVYIITENVASNVASKVASNVEATQAGKSPPTPSTLSACPEQASTTVVAATNVGGAGQAGAAGSVDVDLSVDAAAQSPTESTEMEVEPAQAPREIEVEMKVESAQVEMQVEIAQENRMDVEAVD
jgi:hypothetical protein